MAVARSSRLARRSGSDSTNRSRRRGEDVRGPARRHRRHLERRRHWHLHRVLHRHGRRRSSCSSPPGRCRWWRRPSSSIAQRRARGDRQALAASSSTPTPTSTPPPTVDGNWRTRRLQADRAETCRRRDIGTDNVVDQDRASQWSSSSATGRPTASWATRWPPTRSSITWARSGSGIQAASRMASPCPMATVAAGVASSVAV